MSKALFFPVLLAAGCVIAGLYGALHNQISYTVAPEYFHSFKFRQFRIPEEHHNRVGAALVGWHASWWMGLFIGIPVLLVGLILPGGKVYFTRCLLAYGVVALTALVTGLGTLAYASWSLPDLTPFDRAGTMHNCSYLGGFLGILTGAVYLIVERVRLGRTAAGA